MTWIAVLTKLAIGIVAWQIADRTRSVVVNVIAVIWLALGGGMMLLTLLAGFSLAALLGGIVMLALAWHAWKYGPTPSW